MLKVGGWYTEISRTGLQSVMDLSFEDFVNVLFFLTFFIIMLKDH